MKTLRSISNLRAKLEGHGKSQFFISLNTSGSGDRPRTRSTVTIWNLPDSVLVFLLKGIHIKDLLSLRSVHPHFQNIIDIYSTLWTFVSFAEAWPTKANVHHFIRAYNNNNIEATIKLAVSCLYKEGLTKDDVCRVGQESAMYLCQAEALTPNTFPFFWIFIRPPWAPDGSCCKVQAFNCIKKVVDETNNKDLAFGVALTLKLQRLSVHGTDKEDEKKYFKIAMDQQSAPAIFFSLLDVISDEEDAAKELERVRLLRHLANGNILEAKLNLVRSYMQGHYGGISVSMAKEYVQHFFASSTPSRIHLVFSEGLTSDISRYILVDWLVEVVGMKDFSAHTLYLAVSMFDRYLQVRNVQRSQVQLLGVAAMVISSRFLGFDILTIREAAWLTDNSYSYQDVVKMMGELVAAIKGNIRVLTIQDYIKVLITMAGESGYAAMLVEYIAMLCLLQSEMGQYSPAEIAASCLLLTRLLMNKENPWPEALQDWTGFSQEYLGLCTFHIHKKCLLEGAEVDYRDAKLQAVKMRYADPNRFSVSNIEIIGQQELCRRLGVTQLINHGKNTKAIRFRNTDELIMSPQRGGKRLQFWGDVVDRNNAATPPIRISNAFDENISGYDGDLEEEDSDESMSDNKSDILFELNDESFLSDPSDESNEWDSEQSLMEDEHGKDIGYHDRTGLCLSGANDNRDIGGKDGSLACLSSLCQFGNNMNCLASGTSSSCCKSNCSCQQSDFTAQSSSQMCLRMNNPNVFSFSGLGSKNSSNDSSAEKPEPVSHPSRAKQTRSRKDDINVSVSNSANSVDSGSSKNSSNVSSSHSRCDTHSSALIKHCDVYSTTISHKEYFRFHSLNDHFDSSCSNTVIEGEKMNASTEAFGSKSSQCELQKGLIHIEFPFFTSVNPSDMNNQTQGEKMVVPNLTHCSIYNCSPQDNKNGSITRKSKSFRQQSFTRLPIDDGLKLSQNSTSHFTSPPKCSFLSLNPNENLQKMPKEMHIPCTPEFHFDTFSHSHFTRSNSAFRIASNTPLFSDFKNSNINMNFSKKGKVEPSYLPLKPIALRDIAKAKNTCPITDNNRILSFHETPVNESLTKRKRKH